MHAVDHGIDKPMNKIKATKISTVGKHSESKRGMEVASLFLPLPGREQEVSEYSGRKRGNLFHQ